MIRLLIADDHQLLRDGLRKMLSEEATIRIVGEAQNGHEVLAILKKQEVDVILMDINMPEMNGVETTARVTSAYDNIKILALTMLEQGSFVQLMLRNGASGYLSKNTGSADLIAAIHAVHAGKRYLGEHATEMLLASVARQQTVARSLIPTLTRREKEVLHLIMQGMSDAEISGVLFISPTTAESHRKNLRSKLGAKNSAEIVRIAMERGMV
jgi:DNA-binding NarL/FixJ family response regulator